MITLRFTLHKEYFVKHSSGDDFYLTPTKMNEEYVWFDYRYKDGRRGNTEFYRPSMESFVRTKAWIIETDPIIDTTFNEDLFTI